MPAWSVDPRVLANSESLTAGTAVEADTSGLREPVVLVKLEDLEGAADDTVTIRVDGAAATYTVHEETLASTGSITVDVPRTNRVELESSGGVTYSAEVRTDA